MKKHFNFLFFAAAALLVLASCKKEENKIFFEGGTPPALTASTSAVVLAPGLEDQTAVIFTWTNPEYRFTTGISSQDVSYSMEIDTVGANFGSKNKYTTTISKDLSKSFTVAELNNIMGNTMLLKTGRQYNFESRITSSIGSSAAVPLTSSAVRFTATPFAPPPKVELPSSGKLYLVGDASPGGWNNPVPTPSQEFTKVSNTLYELTVSLSGGKSLLFLPVNGDWGDKYGWSGSNNANVPEGDNLRRGGGDIKVPAASGNYKITVDFQLGKFTITKL